MELGTVMSVAQTLFTALQCSELKEMCSLFGYKSELEDLKRTVSTVRAVLKDAEVKQMLSHQAQLYIDELKDAVYDADDLLDEFVTLNEQQQLIEGDNVSQKVRLFFSRFYSLIVMSKGVNKIRKKLDFIASNYDKYGFKVDYDPVKIRRDETYSYVNASDIVGREVDVENILGMVQDCDVQGNYVSFISIVGIGGMGKTALAQLLYNDSRVKSEFSSRMWACISDQDQKHMDVKVNLEKILHSATGGKYDGRTMDSVQSQVHKHLIANKFLLVLDDVWTEDREQWLKLQRLLKEGRKGSWVVVTTRSKETALIVGSGLMYELQGLSEDNSWCLFQMTAFHQVNPPDDLVEIGHQILKRCADVPLAIRVVGSLLYGQSKTKWHLFKEKGLGIGASETGITPILMLSYHNLEPALKTCFTYCAIFPKDFKIDKEILIRLWMAQGYIVPSKEGQGLEEAAEECFLILLRRCFFQEMGRNKFGEVMYCKIHDLMHDIAQNVAGKEICEADPNMELDERVRHMSVVGHNFLRRSLAKRQIRTCLYVSRENSEFLVTTLLANCMRLRTLNLSDANLELLPKSIGNLLHLRYLDLTDNHRLKALPSSLTNLHNLQTFTLKGCYNLKEFPKDLRKLRKLRVIDMSECYGLTYLPPGIGKLTFLHTLLGRYMVGWPSSCIKKCFDQLEDLKALCHLKGSLQIHIRVPTNPTNVKEEGREGAYLKRKEQLSCVELTFRHLERYASVVFEEELLEELQPHSNLKELILKGWRGARMPTWAIKDKFLPNLLKLELIDCESLQQLPWLGRLRYLKEIRLESLPKLEYVESETSPSGQGSQSFACLEEIRLVNLPKLRGWWQTLSEVGCGALLDVEVPCSSLGRLSQVQSLQILKCPEMISIPLSPNVRFLCINDRLEPRHVFLRTELAKSFQVEYFSASEWEGKWVSTDNLGLLKKVPLPGIQHVTELDICCDKKVECLTEVGELFRAAMTSLRKLKISFCPKLKSLYGGLEHLKALEELLLFDTPDLLNNNHHPEDGEVKGVPWRHLSPMLLVLELRNLPELEHLPEGMQCLTSLKSLLVSGCLQLQSLPNWMSKLTTLKELELHWCSNLLNERCQNPTGEDWPKIKHIPHLSIMN